MWQFSPSEHQRRGWRLFRTNICTHTCLPTLSSRAVLAQAGEALVKPIAVWTNQTEKSASLTGRDYPLFSETTIKL